MALVLKLEKRQGKELSAAEEKFLAEDSTSMNVGVGSSQPQKKKMSPPKTDDEFRAFIDKRKKRQNTRPGNGKYSPQF